MIIPISLSQITTTNKEKEKITEAKRWANERIENIRSFILTNGSVKDNQLLSGLVIAVVIPECNRSNINKILREYNHTQSFIRMYAITEDQLEYDEDLQGGFLL